MFFIVVHYIPGRLDKSHETEKNHDMHVKIAHAISPLVDTEVETKTETPQTRRRLEFAGTRKWKYSSAAAQCRK